MDNSCFILCDIFTITNVYNILYLFLISIINEHKNRYNIDNNHILCYFCIKSLFLYMIVVFIKSSLSQHFIKFNNEKHV